MDSFNLKTKMNVYYKASCPKLPFIMYCGASTSDIITADLIKQLSESIDIEPQSSNIVRISTEKGDYAWFCSPYKIIDISYGNMTIDYELESEITIPVESESLTYYCYRTTYALKKFNWKFVVDVE